MTRASELTLAFLAGCVAASLVAAVLWNNPDALVATAPSRSAGPRIVSLPAAPYVNLLESRDLSGWRAHQMRAQGSGERSPSGAIVTDLIEDAQNSWRNASIIVFPVVRNRAISITAEINFGAARRQAVLMAFVETHRFACNLKRVTSITTVMTWGDGAVGTCKGADLADGWRKIELTGTLPVGSDKAPVFLAIAMTAEGFREDYQGDGKSSLLVGRVTFAQLLQ